MSLKIKATRGLKWQAITIVGRQLLSLVVFTILARLLDPKSFGLVAAVGVYLNFITIFAEQGIGTALIQRKTLLQEHLDSAFWFNLSCAASLSILTIVFAAPVAHFFHDDHLIPLLRWSSLALPINATATIHAALFTKSLDFKRPAVRVLIANLIGGITGVCMAFAGFGVWALIGQQLASSAGGALFLWMVSPYRPSTKFTFTHLRDLLYVSSSTLATSILWFISSRCDQIAIQMSPGGAEALGIYVVANKGPDIAQLITHQPMAEVSLPALSHIQDDHAKMRSVIYSGMEMNAIISFAVFVGMACVAGDLIPFLFGSKWHQSAIFCALLSIYSLMNALQVFFHPAILASGGIGKYVILNIWFTVGVLGACFFGIRHGIPWLISGLIINSLIIFVPNLMFLKSRIGLSPARYLGKCVVPALASILMLGAVFLAGYLMPRDLSLGVKLLGKIVLGAVVYVSSVRLLAPTAFRKLSEILIHAVRGQRSQMAAVSAPLETLDGQV